MDSVFFFQLDSVRDILERKYIFIQNFRIKEQPNSNNFVMEI